MTLDKDLQARQEARDLVKAAAVAQRQLACMEQSQLDRIAEAISTAFYDRAAELARLAVQETGFGNEKDKTVKNQFASRSVWEAIKNMKTVGLLKEDPAEKLWEKSRAKRRPRQSSRKFLKSFA